MGKYVSAADGEPVDVEEASICAVRGHSPGHTMLMSNPPQFTCRWCKNNYFPVSAGTNFGG